MGSKGGTVGSKGGSVGSKGGIVGSKGGSVGSGKIVGINEGIVMIVGSGRGTSDGFTMDVVVGVGVMRGVAVAIGGIEVGVIGTATVFVGSCGSKVGVGVRG